MSQVSRTTAKTYFNTGDIPTETQFANTLDSIPFFEDNAYTALSGTTWDGSPKTKTLTANLVLTFSSTRRSGKLKIKQDATGGRTLTINGISIPILSAANSVSLVWFDYDDVAAEADFFVDTSYAGNITGGGGAVTLNTPGSFNATAISDSEIDLTWVDTNTSPNESGYTIYWNGTNDFGSAAILATPAAGATSYNHTGLGASSSFYYWIKANGNGTTTSDSATATDTATTMAGGSIDSDAQLVIDAINLTAAGPLSGADEGYINDLVVDLKAAGTWAITDRIIIACWEDQDANGINWKNPSGAALDWVGSPTHGPTGVSGIGISPDNLNTLAHVSQNSLCIRQYKQSAPVPPGLESYMGCQDATNTAGVYYYAGPGGNVGGGMNNGEAVITTLSPAAGYEAWNRVLSTEFTCYRNGALVHTATVASVGVPAQKMKYGAMNGSGGSALYVGTAIWTADLIGGGQTPTQMADEYTAIQAFMTAKGIDV